MITIRKAEDLSAGDGAALSGEALVRVEGIDASDADERKRNHVFG